MSGEAGFSSNLPSRSSMESITITLSGLYCLLTVSVYIVLTTVYFTKSDLQRHEEVEVR